MNPQIVLFVVVAGLFVLGRRGRRHATLGGLGFPPAEHALRAPKLFEEALRRYDDAQAAIAKGDCYFAIENVTAGDRACAVAESHVEAAKAGGAHISVPIGVAASRAKTRGDMLRHRIQRACDRRG